MNLRFKEGQMVKMTGHDDMIVEGAIGIITDVQTETVKVLWGGMSAFKVDYKYRYGLKEITTTEVADKLSSWPTETPEDSIIEESIGDEIVLTLENEFSREVTFYERN